MRILVESFDLHDLGGSGTSLRFYIDFWQRQGAEVHAHADVLGIEATCRLAPDLIISHQWARSKAAVIADALRIPLVALVHGPGQFAPTPMSRMVIFCSSWLAEHEPEMQDRVSVVVAPPIDPTRCVSDRVGEGTYLTLISSDDHVKGVDRFIQFASELPEYQFLLVSDGIHTDLPSNVVLRRRAADVRPIYADTKLLLLPSRNDSAPRVIVEAALNGIPTLASDLPGVHEASFGLTRVVGSDNAWPETIRQAICNLAQLRQDACELAERRLAQQTTQLDECWSKMQALIEAHKHDALLSLVMIVKNEAHGIKATLESVRSAVDWWTIVDTGSDDGTPEAIQEVLAGIPGELHHAPFIDFSTTRNLALALAEPKARFQLMLSGDEILEGAGALREFCLVEAAKAAPDREAYDVSVRFGTGTVYASPRLTRAGTGWKYAGVTHEALVKPGASPPRVRVPDVHVLHNRRDAAAQRQRWETDLKLLRDAANRDPPDTRTIFYLAQTLECLGLHEEATEVYQRRVSLGGWSEEVYEAKVRIAGLLQRIGRPWTETQQAYLDAHAYSPHRAESLVAIAQHWYGQGNHALTFLFAQRAAQIPYPTQCRLFVDAETYRYKAHDLVGISAYYLGLYDIGRAAVEVALRAHPADQRLRNNLRFYEERDQRNPQAFYKQVIEVANYGSRVELFRTWAANRKVLHIGCADYPVFDPANNLHMQIASAAKEIVGLDVSEEGLAQLHGHLPGRYYTDIAEVADEEFDLVLMPETIEHIGDAVSALTRVLHTLRFTEFVVTGPNYHYWATHAKYENGRFYETVHPDHCAWYSPSTLRRLLCQVTIPTDEVELFFVNGQSMVGARVTRHRPHPASDAARFTA